MLGLIKHSILKGQRGANLEIESKNIKRWRWKVSWSKEIFWCFFPTFVFSCRNPFNKLDICIDNHTIYLQTIGCTLYISRNRPTRRFSQISVVFFQVEPGRSVLFKQKAFFQETLVYFLLEYKLFQTQINFQFKFKFPGASTFLLNRYHQFLF